MGAGHGPTSSLDGAGATAKTPGMTRYGQQFGPDFTFLGVPMCDLDDPASYADAQVVILGAPFDGGTSARSGARFGPMAIRMCDYLGHDGERPSLALRTDGLKDLAVVDAELGAPRPVEVSTRPVGAPELLADMDQVRAVRLLPAPGGVTEGATGGSAGTDGVDLADGAEAGYG